MIVNKNPLPPQHGGEIFVSHAHNDDGDGHGRRFHDAADGLLEVMDDSVCQCLPVLGVIITLNIEGLKTKNYSKYVGIVK